MDAAGGEFHRANKNQPMEFQNDLSYNRMTNMKEKFIETENYITLHELVSRLVELDGNAERMGLAFGNFGLGKTFSLERIAAQFDAILLRTNQTWTVASTLRLLAEELAIDPRGRASDVMERITQEMMRHPRVVIVDEIDTLLPAVKFPVLELFRDIHDQVNNVFLMVGMENCDGRLKAHKHFYSRIVAKAKFKQIPRDDIAKFCTQCEIKVEDDLIGFFASKYPNLRQVKVFLLRIENWAELNGVESIGLKLFKQSGVEHAEK